jgi:hypothetical protein
MLGIWVKWILDMRFTRKYSSMFQLGPGCNIWYPLNYTKITQPVRNRRQKLKIKNEERENGPDRHLSMSNQLWLPYMIFKICLLCTTNPQWRCEVHSLKFFVKKKDITDEKQCLSFKSAPHGQEEHCKYHILALRICNSILVFVSYCSNNSHRKFRHNCDSDAKPRREDDQQINHDNHYRTHLYK